MTPVVTLGLLLVVGLLAGLAAARTGFPRVGAYVLAGMAFSPSVLGGVLGLQLNPWSEPLTTVALGYIAYVIGGSMTARQVRRSGPAILGATGGGTFGPVITVTVVVLVLAPDVPGLSVGPLAMALGVIASTTAPAATVAVLHQYRARGPVTNTLLGVVALDDALGIVLFSFLLVATSGESPLAAVGHATVEIGGAVLLGGVCALGLATLGRRIGETSVRLPLILGMILLVVGVAEMLRLTGLLACMTLGFVARAVARTTGDRMLGPIENLEEVVFVMFFTLAGAHFDPSVFGGHLGLVAAYVGARMAGKIGGATLGTRLVHAPAPVVRWVGPALLPQAGVAIGLALTLVHDPAFAGGSAVILNVVLAATVVHEIVGPLCARFALERAGELGARRERA